MQRKMIKLLSILLLICTICVVFGVMRPTDAEAATATKLVLKVNSEWTSDGARFAAYFFNNSTGASTWVSMTSKGNNIYICSVPSGYPNVIFCRMNGGNSTNSWDNKWNQSSDLTVPADTSCMYTMKSGWWDGDNGTWGACSHSWDSGTVTKAATCSATGTKTYTCNYCSGTKTETIAKTAHNYAAATCTSAQKCKSCGATTGSALGHSYSYKATKNPTESATGTLTGTCSRCSGTTTVTLPKLTTSNYTRTQTKAPTCTATGTYSWKWNTTSYGTFTFTTSIAAKGHSWKAATCTAPKTCSTCSATDGSKLGHSYSYKATKNPTTSATGTLTGTCSRCSGTTTVTLPKLTTSNYTRTQTKAPTCTATGTYSWKWNTTTYGTFTFTTSIAATGHSYGNASCSAPATCTTCGATTGSALGHNYSYKVTKNPTTSATGTLVGTCTRCSASTGNITIGKLGTTYHTYKVTKAATCTAAGTGRYTWGITDYGTYYWDVEIPATGHNYAAATCTKPKTCSTCGATSGSALGHSYTSKVTKEATCTADGVRTYTCSQCSSSYTEAIGKLGHSYTAKVTAPTCTAQGYTTHTCSRCSDSYKDTYKAATGHSYSSKVTTAATCEKDGVKTFTCSSCSHSYTESIAATGHSYSGGKCGNCGSTKTVALPGDFNNWDAQAMTWTSSGYTYSVKLSAGTYKFKVIKDGTWLGNNGEIWDTTTATSSVGWEFADWGNDCTLVATGGTYNFTFNFDTNMLVITYTHTHAYTAGTVVAPTCTAKGYTVYTCPCGSTENRDEKAATGHSYTSKVTKEATCTADGVRTYTCSKCSNSYTEAIGKLGHSYTSKVTAPTCTAQGYTTHTCSRCSDSYKDSYKDATGHNYSYAVATNPTTSAAGSLKGTCSKCNGTTSVTLPKLNTTDYSYSVTTQPTCTATGTGKYTWKTTTYGSYSFTVTIAAKGHSYGNASCTAPATCTVCGTSTGSALGHSYTYSVTKEPTTSASGTLTGTCSRCSSKPTVTLPKLNTTDYSYSVTKAATCTATGTGKYTWKTTTYGSYSFTVTIAATGHNYSAKVTAPTCTAQGYTTHTCANCSDTYKDTYTNATGHSYSSKVTKEATCTADGVKTFTCSKCSDSYTEAIAKLGHSYTSKVTAPTCTAQGYTTHTCSRCSDSYKDSYKDATGHSYSSKVTTAATCENAGVRTYTCGNCAHSYTESIPAIGHNYVGGKCGNCGDTKVVSVNGTFNNWAGDNMTWTSSGYTFNIVLSAGSYEFKIVKDGTWMGNNGTIEDTTVKTSAVGWEFVGNDGYGNCILAATGGTYTFTFNFDTNMLVIEYVHTHAYTAGTVVAPTCTAKGYTVYTCPCGDTENRDEKAPLGHSWNGGEITKAPTCTDKGVKTYTCTVCGETKTEDVAATGHSYTSKITAPTCTAEGYTTYTCANCGDSYVADKVAATGHDYKAVVTKPTCTAGGYTTHTCANCSDSYVDTYTEATGHHYVGDTCTGCGDVREYYLIGWINGANMGCEEDYANLGNYKFVDGRVTVVFQQDSYVFVKTGDNAAWYMTNGYCTDKSATLYNTNSGIADANKMFVPGGLSVTFTLVVNNDETLVLSYVIDSCTHNYTSEQTKAPTCETAGEMTYTCDLCGDVYTQPIAALGHDYKATVTAPTCTESGYTTHTCQSCGDSYVDSYTNAIGHNYVGDTCQSCGDVREYYLFGYVNGTDYAYGDYGNFLGELKFVDGKLTLTMTTDSYVAVKADDNWTWYMAESYCTDKTVILKNTALGDHVREKMFVPGGTTVTFTLVINADDTLTLSYVIDACEHTYESVVTAPTCTEGGYTTHTCSKCDDTYTDTYTEATGHNYVGDTCQSCGDVREYYLFGYVNGTDYAYGDYGNFLGELKFVDGKLTLTMTTDSYVAVKADDNWTWYMAESYCTDKTVILKNTALGEHVSEKLFVPGGTVVTFTLVINTDDTLTLSYVIDSCEHTYESVVTAPTCTEGGYTTHTCSKCDDTYTDTYTEATGHSYVGDTCTACGAKRDYYLIGWINGMDYGFNDDAANLGEYKFVSGKLVATFTSDSYVFIKTGDNLSWYQAEGYCTDKTVILYNDELGLADPNKLFVPGGVEITFTLVVNDDETLVLSYVISKCSHSYNDGQVTKAPTCEAAGEMTYTCSICGETYTEVIAALGHSYSTVVTKPTCTEGGYTTYICGTCGHSYVADQVAALGHSYTSEVTAPTCTAGGYTTYTCSVCGDSYVGDQTAALGHNYTAEQTKAPTCETAGENTFTCSNCSDSYTEVIPATGHNYVNGTCGTCGQADPDAKYITVYFQNNWLWTDVHAYVWTEDGPVVGWPGAKATFYANDGTYDIYCVTILEGASVIFNGTKNDGSGAVDQTPDIVAPQNGDCYWMVWNDGNAVEKDNILNIYCDHSYTSEQTKAPTCETAGEMTYTCDLCGKSYTEEIAALGHSYAAVITKPTCETAGYTTYTCGTCGHSYVGDEVAALGHNYTAEQTKAPTCETAGETTYTCSNCGHSYTEPVAATGHNYVDNVCSSCGHVKPADETITVYFQNNWLWTDVYAYVWVGETPVVGWPGTPATFYANDGSYDIYCVTIPANANVIFHGVKNDGTGAQDQTPDIVAPKDGDCYWMVWNDGNAVEKDNILNVYCDHSYTSEQTKAPTCTDKGEMTYTCSKCGDSYTEEIAALGHTYEAKVTAPTCTEPGHTTYTCACGDSYVGDETAALGHNFVDGVCDRCGEKAPVTETITVYFQNNWLWTDVYAYVWVGETPVVGWPGTPATFYANDGTYDIYCVTMPANANVIFHGVKNDGSGNSDQTPDIKGAQDGDCYWMVWSDGNATQKDHIDNVYTPVCEHNYTAEQTKAPTCTEKGIKTYTCSKCGDSYTEEIPATGHTFVDGTCTGCGEAAPVTDYYLIGYINGADYGCNEDGDNLGIYKFVDGQLVVTFGSDSYVFIKTGDNLNWYMFEGYCEAASGTLYNTNSGIADPNKMFVPGGVEVTFTLTVNDDDTLTLSYVQVTCEHGYTEEITKAPTCDQAGEKTYTCSKCGDSYTEEISALGHSYVNGVCTVCGHSKDSNIKIHFVNTLGWQGVVGYAWKDTNGTTSKLNGISWPGIIVQRDNEGYYTMELEYTPVSGQSIGVLFHDFYGNQTADVTISYEMLSTSHEIWVKPATSKTSGKYNCTVSTSEGGMVISPEINGQQITFRYAGTASSVYLAGTMNNWSTSATAMTKGEDGVWSVTLTLNPGVYEYKFVVDGAWILDPTNGNVGGYDGNSVLVVPADDVTTNNGKITVVLHFYRANGNYSGWDVWYWGSETSGSATFSADPNNKGMIATFTIDGTKNSNVGYTIRKSDWSDKEFYDRFIDLSDVVSGTVHYYVNSGVATGSRVLGEDVVSVGKLSYANYDYESSTVWVKAALPLANPLAGNFSIVDANGNATGITVTSATLDNYGYKLTLSKSLTITQANTYKVKYENYYADIHLDTNGLFYSSKFASEYTYNGNDLGATWSRNSTTFKVWAPTALNVHVKIYDSGNYGSGNQVKYVQMTQGDKGVWTVTVSGNWHGYYYNYDVSFENYTVEATDPYARSTGANGDRGMILNLDATDPAGWSSDISPNQGMSYTDAIIYELHVREFTNDSNSGVKAEWRGNYLGLTQSGTSYQGYATGLDYLKELGVTHVQLMPVTDFSSVDEYHDGYAWGYDPKNFNTPEGSYSTNPYDGAVRVNEFKQMVQTLHSNGINVVMDVVFNHAFDGGNFCYNQIVPNYFSRFYGEGNWSNGSGVGNDLATERTMTRNYIVDTILYWVEEYHIDGFRFDLAGLIDTTTIKEIVNTVHAKYPYVIFYGEGWAPGDTAVEYGNTLATKDQAWQLGGFGFFNDDYRNGIAGDNGNSWGFASGSWDYENSLGNWFEANNTFSKTPTQTINYVSCHDNYCLTDKLLISRNGAYWSEIAKMNALSNAIVMLSEGVPFLYSGDEMLRERKDYYGNRLENAHSGGDYANTINWSDLVYKQYAAETSDYYKGLIEFRKNHAALRISDSSAQNYVSYYRISDQTVLFYISGYPNYECSDGIVVIFNASSDYVNVNLNNYGIPYGYWQATIHGDQAGVTPLWGVDVNGTSGTVGVEGISTTVLVLGDLIDENSVYNKQASKCSHSNHNTSAMCTSCGKTVSHNFVNGTCACGLSQNAPATYTVYFDNSTNNWSNVSIYAWTTTAGQTKEYAGSWSGSAMTLIDEENNIYAYELPIGAQNIIFSGDGSQTDNLTAPGYTSDATLYSNGSWIVYEGACEHIFSDEYIEEPTCILGGVVKHTCTLCGFEFTEEVEALGHDYVTEVTEPTCTTGGYTTYTCACGDSYVDEEVPALRHDYADGICSVCGTEKAYFLFGYINGANYGCDGDEATMGIYKFVDGVLTVTFTQDSYIGIKTIDNENWYMTNGYLGEDVTIATLYDTSVGIDANKLFVPGQMKITFTMVINEDGTVTLSYEAAACEHEYESVITAPSCTENGYTTHTCIYCGDSYTDSETEATGHNFADGFCHICGAIDPAVCEHEYDEGVVTEPTCTEGGYTTYTCSICGHSYVSDETEALGHSYEDVVTEPTCTEGGYTTHTCIYCGDSYTDSETEATGHNFVDGFCEHCGAVDPATCEHEYESVVTEPTCTEGGYTTNTCPICGNVEITDETEPTGHTYEAVITDPTCTEGGYTTYTCACGDSYIADETEATGHDFVDGFCSICGAIDPAVCEHEYDEGVVTEPTCTEGGYTTYTCTVCGHSYTADETETIDHDYVDGFCSVCGKEQPIGCEHEYESVVTEPTCTEAGYTTHTCSKCGDSYTDSETEALGHDFVDGTCSICGGKDVGNCEHEYVKTAVDASCTEQGGDKYTCSKCGHSYLENATDALGHNYVNGICDRCGDLKPLSTTYYLVGWINGGNHGCEEDSANMGNYPITSNMFKYTFDQTSYVFLKTEGNGKWFMCDGYPGDGVCFANLYDTGLPIKHDKVNVPGGVEITFTLIERDDGSVTLTYVTAGNCSHNWYTQTQVWPGCTTTGVMLHRCIMCADSYTTTIPAKGHSYNGGSNCWDCGAQNPNYTYYYQIVGWINGQNVGCEENWEQPGYQFSGNRLTMTFTENSYIYLKTHDNSKWFMTDGYPGDDATSATFYHTDSYWEIQKDKLFVPKGRTITFTLSVRSDNTIYLSYVAASCQHTYDSWMNAEATCTTDGERAYKCTKCDDYYTEVIKATGHNFSGTSCSNCGAVAPGQAQIYYLVGYINGANYGCEEDYKNMGIYKFVDGQLIVTFSADSYVYIKTQGNTKWFLTQSYVEANSGTFYEGGTEKMKVPGGIEYRFTLVENADGSLTLTYGPSNCTHGTVTEEITAPTCTEGGFTTVICSICGHREITNLTEATGHSFVDGSCEHCGAIDPAVCEHVYDEGIVTAPTCTEKGYTTYNCTICGTVHVGNETATIPHNFVDGVCTECGAEDLDPSEIFYLIGWINGKDYGCEDDYKHLGIYKFVDGKLMVKFAENSYVYIKTGDNQNWFMTETYVDGVSGIFANTSTGAMEKMLIPGGVEVILTLVVNEDGTLTLSYELAECEGHSYTDTVIAPTCTLPGYTLHTCSACGFSYADTETAATGHNFVDGTCTGCGESQGETPEPDDGMITVYFQNNWLWTDVYVYFWTDEGANAEWPGAPATWFANDGTYDIYCVTMPAGSNVIFSGTKDDGSGSDQTPDIVGAEDGDIYWMVWNDGNAVEKDNIDNILGDCEHDYQAVVTEPGCKTPGYTTHTCVYCGDSYVDTHTAPVGHSYADGFCTVCGEAQILEDQDFYLIGYINGANYGCDEDWENLGIYKFVDGKLVVHFKQDSYVFVKTGDNANWFMTEGFGGTEIPYAELFNTYVGLTDANKLFVPGGMKISFVLVRTGEDTFILGYTVSECEHPEHTITGKCVYCGDTVEHTYEITENGYTCTEMGGVKHECACGASYMTDTVPATGHAFVDGSCKYCGLMDESGCEHEYILSIDPGKCNLAAYTVNTCVNCGNVYHVYFNADVDWNLEKPVDVHEDLLQTKPMYSYRDLEITTGDTDTLEGWTLVGSELIDEELGIYLYTFQRWTEWSDWSDEEIEATETREVKITNAYNFAEGITGEHDYVGVITEPTCTEMGYTTYTCSLCGESHIRDYTDPKGHSYEDVVTAPGCKTQGYTTHTCSECGDSYVDSYTDPTGHNFVEGMCECGAYALQHTSASLSLESEIKYNLYFYLNDDSIKLENVGLLTFKTQPTDATIENADYVLSTLAYDAEFDSYAMRSQGVPAKEMGDALYMRLYATLEDGTVIYGKLINYSAKKFAMNTLNRASSSEALKNTVVALMNYGAEAQKLLNYKVDDLMNAEIPAEYQNKQVAYNADLLDARVKADTVKVAGLTATEGAFSSMSAMLTMKGALAINYLFLPGKTVDNGQVTLYYWTANTYAGAEALTLENADGTISAELDGSYYQAVYGGISAKDIDDTVYVLAVYESEGEICMSGVVSYSIEHFCRSQVSRETENQALCEKLTIYSYYAKLYFGIA